LEPGSISSKSINNYFPSTSTTSIEFVYDPTTSVFAVGKPNVNLQGSPHEQLAKTIGPSVDDVVGGIFRRNTVTGEILTNESSGHFHQNWNDEVRKVFIKDMDNYGVNVNHSEGHEK
jgi:filamentous hemagglutinin